MNKLKLDPSSVALVLIDLQQGVVSLNLAPRSGADVVVNSARLAQRFRERGAQVVLVRVAFSQGNVDLLVPETDAPAAVLERPANWATLVPELGSSETDIIITKRQWGGFHGTELDLQLRRRGITTLVMGGIATNMGVESTARSAFEHGYNQVFVEDAMASFTDEMHGFVFKAIFPRFGRVRSTEEVLQALEIA